MSTRARTVKVAALMAVPVALGLAACGGPSKSSLVSKADGICRTFSTATSSKKPTSYPELADSAKSLATAADTQVTELNKLSVPDGDKTTVKAVFAALGTLATSAHRIQDAAAKLDDKAAAAAANEAHNNAKDASDRAKVYGFNSCGTGTQAALTPVYDGTNGIVKAAFVAKAEAICKDLEKKSSAVRQPTSSSARAFGVYLDSILAVSNKGAADLHALAIPPGDDSTVNAWLADLDALNAKVAEASKAAKAGDQTKVVAIAEASAPLETAANAKADAYGVRACGTGSILS